MHDSIHVIAVRDTELRMKLMDEHTEQSFRINRSERLEVRLAAAARRGERGVVAVRPVGEHRSADVQLRARHARRADGAREAFLIAGEHGREEVAVTLLESDRGEALGRRVDELLVLKEPLALDAISFV